MADWNGFKKNGTAYIPNDATARAGVIANTKLIKDTVGWSGKNKFNETIVGKAIFGNDNEGFHLENSEYGLVYIAKVDNNTDYIVSKEAGDRFRIVAMANHPTTTNQAGHEIVNNNSLTSYEFNSSAYNYIIFTANFANAYTLSNIKGMIRPADILDPTYEPYFGSTAFPRSEQAVLGAKNLWKTKSNFNTTTVNGVTFSADSKKKIDVNGTATAVATADLGKVTFSAGNYIATGCPANGSAESYRLNVSKIINGQEQGIGFDYGDGVEFTLTEDTIIQIYPRIANGYTANNLIFSPMIRLATDPDDSYAPPSMTNLELTALDKQLNSEGVNSLSAFLDTVSRVPSGNLVYVTGAVISELTNTALNLSGKLTVFNIGGGTIDWYGMVGANGFVAGRLQNGQYSSHVIIKQPT